MNLWNITTHICGGTGTQEFEINGENKEQNVNSLKSDVVTLSRENNKLNSEKDILKKKLKTKVNNYLNLNNYRGRI